MRRARSEMVLAACLALCTIACGDDADTSADGGSSSTAGTVGSADDGNDDGGDDGVPTADDSDSSDDGVDSDSSTGGADPQASVLVSLFNVTMGIADPRWPTVPATISTVQLPPQYTLQATVPPDTASVRFILDEGAAVLDTAAPFRLAEDEAGVAIDSPLAVGIHGVVVEAFESVDGTGDPIEVEDVAFEITRDGTLESPSEHTSHRMWRTDGGTYVYRDRAGDFVDAAGSVVISGADVSTVEMGDGQGHFVVSGGGEGIEFAFIVLLPDGFDASVPYPLVVFLHHGWEVYRGTDNDGLPLDAPLLGGPRSLVSAPEQRTDYPAIVLVPQMRQTQNIDGVTHEWAAFTDIDNDTGSFVAAAAVSVNTQPVLDVIDALEAGSLTVNGAVPTIDSARVYLSGHSMGGLGSWDLLGRLPDRWAAGLPMAGYSDHTTAQALTQTPIWAFHHEIDCYNPAIGTQTMHGLITKDNGGTRMRFTLLTFDTGGACDQAHFQTPGAAWDSEPGVFEWMFGQLNDRL
ncbi:MAG: hypothetical protein JKY37_23085 [Nannocystaceae bacterium]|nr:hypothetical protein [Nannocystaceae bacterium]